MGAVAKLYELIGRLVVRLAWARFSHQITIAGAALGLLTAAAIYLVASREPPEG